MRLMCPVQARFHYGYPPLVNLATHRNSQAHSSKGTQSHHVPGGTTLLRLVGTRFQVLFHDPSPGCFSPFPHGTSPLSVTREYSGLGGGPPRFTRDFTGPVLLGKQHNTATHVSSTGVAPSTLNHSRLFNYAHGFLLRTLMSVRISTVPQPHNRNP